MACSRPTLQSGLICRVEIAAASFCAMRLHGLYNGQRPLLTTLTSMVTPRAVGHRYELCYQHRKRQLHRHYHGKPGVGASDWRSIPFSTVSRSDQDLTMCSNLPTLIGSKWGRKIINDRLCANSRHATIQAASTSMDGRCRWLKSIIRHRPAHSSDPS